MSFFDVFLTVSKWALLGIAVVALCGAVIVNTASGDHSQHRVAGRWVGVALVAGICSLLFFVPGWLS